MKRILFFILWLSAVNSLYSQTTDWNIMSRVPAGNNAIKLRWMPANGTDWQKGVANGYTITKKRYSAAGVFEANETSINIPATVASDTSLSKWTAYWKPDSVIYKDLFYITVNKNLILQSAGNTDISENSPHTALEERYFYANVLSDLKFKAAELCGLGYTDAAVTAGKKYEYVITTKGANPVSASTGLITVSTTALPNIPISFTGELRRIKIGWNTTALIDHYGGYYVEKSTNAGASYTRLNTEPFVNLADSTTWMYHVDSIPNVTATYRYRVVGVSYFDELKYSIHKDTTVNKVIEFAPGVRAATISGSNYKVNWRYPHDQGAWSAAPANADLTNYSLAVSRKAEALPGQADFKVIKTGIAKGDTTTTVTRASVLTALSDTTSVFYFFVVATATGSTSVPSAPYGYIPQVRDNTPPSVPTNPVIAAPVDIAGAKSMIRVSWSRSTDNIGGLKGVLGYRVFRTIGTDPEKIEVSGGIRNALLSTDTTKAYIQDTLSKNLDYTLVRYHISAFDHRYNESAAVTVTYTPPDTKRPVPPRILSATLNTNNTVALSLSLSPSRLSETITHEILKKETLAGNWTVVSTIASGQSTSSYTDASATGGKEYFYSIRAKDAAGNYSCDSIPTLAHTITTLPGYCYQVVSVKTLNLTTKAALATLTQAYDENSRSVTLTWTYAQSGVAGYEVYRGITASPTKFAYLAYVKDPLKTYADFKVEFNTAYSYRVRAVFTDGSVSAWKEVTTGNLKKSSLVSNKQALVFTNAAGSEAATITSNVNWTVTKSDSWITTSVTSGSNNGSVTLGVTANGTGTIRQGTVTLASGTVVSTVISITQYSAPSGTGITAKYYNFPDLASIQSRPPNISRLENRVYLDASGSPVSGITQDFSSIWEGFVEVPKTGNYTFYLKADDGANLYLDGKKIAVSTGNTEVTSPAQSLVFGNKYPIRVEHWDASAFAGLRLQWASNVGLSKTDLQTPYLYPQYVPDANQQDPLNDNCFVIRRISNNYTIQTPGNYTVTEGPYSNKNNQKWKLVKDGSLYKIVSQIDGLNKNIQVLNNGSALFDKAILGFNGTKTSEKWELVSQGNNQYKIKRSGSSYFLGFDGPAPALYSGGENFLFENTTCPNYQMGILVDTDELNVDFRQQSQSIALQSDREWSVINYNDWINVSPQGGMQNASVNISVVKNTNSAARSGSVGFKNANGTTYVLVRQEGRPCVEMANVVTGCGTRAVEGITIFNADGSTANNSLYQFSIDNQGVWKDHTYQLSNLSNGPHVLHARKKSDHSCTGSITFEIYCY